MPFILLALCIVAALLSGCTPKSVPPVTFSPGAVVESIQSEVSLSFSSPTGSGGGRGFLVFQHPDRSHLVVLSPFGTTVMEAFTDDDRLTVTIPSKEIAYTGTFSEIPAKGGLQGWQAMRWIVESEPAGKGTPGGEMERVNRDGKRERVWYNDAGLVAGKKSEEGAEVVYREYRNIGGIPFPSVIEYRDRHGVSLKITFDDPEINTSVPESALTPRLDGLTVLSIKRFGGNP